MNFSLKVKKSQNSNLKMMRNFASILIILSVTISCSFTFRDTNEDSEEDLDSNDFDGDNTDWALDHPLNLKGTLRTQFAVDAALRNPEKSLICSPMSALLPLGKLALGAEKLCLKQLLNAIGLSSLSQVKTAFKPLISELEYIKGVTLNIISKIYVSKELKLKSKFKKRSMKIFKSTVEAVDFQSPRTVARDINDWVNKNTNSMIPNIISEHEISPGSSVILINAVYFKGSWKSPFKKVVEDNFYTPAATRRLPMMSREGYYQYSKSDDLDAQVVEIPYEHDEASFVIILPNSKIGLPVLLHKIKLAPRLLQAAMKTLQPTELILTIPKFKTLSQVDLSVAYQKLGLTEIFQTRQSGLENIVKGNKNIYVSQAVQKAVIEVNEFGATAAGVSIMEVATVSLNLNKKIFNANHPFMYFIKYKGEQIFSGTFVH